MWFCKNYNNDIKSLRDEVKALRRDIPTLLGKMVTFEQDYKKGEGVVVVDQPTSNYRYIVCVIKSHSGPPLHNGDLRHQQDGARVANVFWHVADGNCHPKKAKAK